VRNRLVPTDTVLPHITCQDVGKALTSLTTTFGFAGHYRYGEQDGQIQGARTHLGGTWIMLSKHARAARARHKPVTAPSV
jgi:hypothetical protein